MLLLVLIQCLLKKDRCCRDQVVEAIKGQSKDLPDSKQIAQVATISANDDKEIGDKDC